MKRSLSSAVVGMACWTAVFCSAKKIVDVVGSKGPSPLWPRIIAAIFMCGIISLGPIGGWRLRVQQKQPKGALSKHVNPPPLRGTQLQPPYSTSKGHPKSQDWMHWWMMIAAAMGTVFLAGTIVARLTNLFSHPGYKLAGLEQVCAILGGATILTIQLYLVAKHWFLLRKKTCKQVADVQAIHTLEFSTVRTRYLTDPELGRYCKEG